MFYKLMHFPNVKYKVKDTFTLCVFMCLNSVSLRLYWSVQLNEQHVYKYASLNHQLTRVFLQISCQSVN